VISVRAATPDDADAMSAVLIASITELCVADHGGRPEALSRWLANKTPADVRAMLGDPARQTFVAERAGAVAAVGAIDRDDRVVSLNYVSPRHRFKGVSSALLAALETSLGPGEASLDSTATALQFYRDRGWVDSGAPQDWAGVMRAYPMRKMLG
jgi:GNAT superfamily N-acetyltransferase